MSERHLINPQTGRSWLQQNANNLTTRKLIAPPYIRVWTCIGAMNTYGLIVALQLEEEATSVLLHHGKRIVTHGG